MIRKSLMRRSPLWMFLCKTVRNISLHIYAQSSIALRPLFTQLVPNIFSLMYFYFIFTKRRHGCNDIYCCTYLVNVKLFVYQT